MKQWIARAFVVIVGLFFAGRAWAQPYVPPASFPPASAFSPVTCLLVPSTDPCFDVTRDHRNIVGAGATPAFLTAQDGTYLYLRVRVEEDPRQLTAFVSFAWGFGFDPDADGRFDAYVTLIGQGNSDRLEILDQDTGNGVTPDLTMGNPDTSLVPVRTDGMLTWATVTAAPPVGPGMPNFCPDDVDASDWYITVAVPLAALADFGVLGTGVAYAGSSANFTGIQEDFVCSDGDPPPCTMGSMCPTGVCLMSVGLCAPPIDTGFLGCVDDVMGAGVDTGCTSGTPYCVMGASGAVCVACVSENDCVDGNVCTVDACVSGACDNASFPAGTACMGGVCDGAASMPACVTCLDDLPGTAVDAGCTAITPVCDTSGAMPVCAECAADAHCDDGDECTVDACGSGLCSSPPAMAGTPCMGGVCDGALTPACLRCLDDAPGTTIDSGCSAGAPVCDTTGPMPTCTGCLTPADCDDGNECTTDDCAMGACASVPVPPGTGCTGGVCDGAMAGSGCVPCIDDAMGGGQDSGCGGVTPLCDTTGPTPVCVECLDVAQCDDGNACTSDACVAGACSNVAEAPGTTCMGGVCDGATMGAACVVCLDDATGAQQDSGCGMTTPVCDASGPTPVCVQCTVPLHCDDANECTADACTTGTCGNVQEAAGAPCSGGVCTGAGAICQRCIDDALGAMQDSGCSLGAPVCDTSGATPTCVGCILDADCNDGDECTADACVLGACENVSEPAGTLCTGGVCDGAPTTPACIVCLDDASGSAIDGGCNATTPICDTTVGVGPICVVCMDDGAAIDAGCADPNEVCVDDAGVRTCVDCEDSSPGTVMDFGCEVGSPICATLMGVIQCVGCLSDPDCGIGMSCNIATNECMPGCNDSDQCALPAPICSPTTMTCVECLDDMDCRGRLTCNAGGECTFPDSDGDGIVDDLDADDDNDGIPDASETNGVDRSVDTDGDGIQDFEDVNTGPCLDVLQDGVCDVLPEAFDFDGDGVPNHLDLDSDGDGIADLREGGGVDTDDDGRVDGFVDIDGNGLDDALMATPLPLPNTDMIGDANYLDTDSDNDDVPDAVEATDVDGDGVADRTASGVDTDGDGWDDAFDSGSGGTAPETPNHDADGVPDYRDDDDDDDGIPTSLEDANGDGDPTNDDTDDDGTPDYLDPDPAPTPLVGGYAGGALCAVGYGGSASGAGLGLGLVALAFLALRRRRRGRRGPAA